MLDLHQARESVRKCAAALQALFPHGTALTAHEANLRLAASSALRLCECEPAAWGNAPAAVARLLLPYETPAANAFNERAGAASYWAFNLFAVLCAFPTIQRTLIEVAPVHAEGETLSRLRKRMDELQAALNSISCTDRTLSAFTQIILQLMTVTGDLLRTICERDSIDLRLAEYAVREIEDRAKQSIRQSSAAAPLFSLIADRAHSAAWECDRLMQLERAHGRAGADRRVA